MNLSKLELLLLIVILLPLSACDLGVKKVDTWKKRLEKFDDVRTSSESDMETDHSELQKDFKVFVDSSRIGEEQISGHPDTVQTFIRYLGRVTLESKYHVLTEFRTVQAAISKHGHSRIVFLDEDKITVRIYSVDMPEQLPVELQSNELVFQFNGMFHRLGLSGDLPPLLCLPNEQGCY